MSSLTKRPRTLRRKLTRASWEVFVTVGCPAIGGLAFFAIAKGLGW